MVWLRLVFACVLVACGGNGARELIAGGCDRDSECSGGTCVDRRCAECADDAACELKLGAGAACKGGRCSQLIECMADSDCGSGARCANRRCTQTDAYASLLCQTNADCADGSRCQGNLCVGGFGKTKTAIASAPKAEKIAPVEREAPAPVAKAEKPARGKKKQGKNDAEAEPVEAAAPEVTEPVQTTTVARAAPAVEPVAAAPAEAPVVAAQPAAQPEEKPSAERPAQAAAKTEAPAAAQPAEKPVEEPVVAARPAEKPVAAPVAAAPPAEKPARPTPAAAPVEEPVAAEQPAEQPVAARAAPAAAPVVVATEQKTAPEKPSKKTKTNQSTGSVSEPNHSPPDEPAVAVEQAPAARPSAVAASKRGAAEAPAPEPVRENPPVRVARAEKPAAPDTSATEPDEPQAQGQTVACFRTDDPAQLIRAAHYFGSAHVRLGDVPMRVLQQNARCVAGQSASYRVIVEAHTDRHGSAKTNLRLAKRRAEHVKAILRRRGVKLPIEVVAKGESEPACTDNTRKCDALNRRVILKLEQQSQEMLTNKR